MFGASGGGIYSSGNGTVRNSIIYDNWKGTWGQNLSGPGTYINCCTVPEAGSKCITNDPLFVAAEDFHLQSNSPCINTGSNGYVSVTTDLDGNPRTIGGTVDMGAYEFGFEGCFITNCNPTVSGMALEWTAFPMWESTVKYSTNLVEMPFTDLSATMPYPMNSYTDTVHGTKGQCFYKVEIQP